MFPSMNYSIETCVHRLMLYNTSEYTNLSSELVKTTNLFFTDENIALQNLFKTERE